VVAKCKLGKSWTDMAEYNRTKSVCGVSIRAPCDKFINFNVFSSNNQTFWEICVISLAKKLNSYICVHLCTLRIFNTYLPKHDIDLLEFVVHLYNEVISLKTLKNKVDWYKRKKYVMYKTNTVLGYLLFHINKSWQII